MYKEKKTAAWEKLADDFAIETLNDLTNEISLDEVKDAYTALIDGKAVGRYLVKL